MILVHLEMSWEAYHIRIRFNQVPTKGVDSLQNLLKFAGHHLSRMLKSVCNKSHWGVLPDDVQEHINRFLHINVTLSFLQISMLFLLIDQMIEQLQRHAKHLKTLLRISISNLIHVTTSSQNACMHWMFVIMSLHI